MSSAGVDMSPKAISARLAEASALSDLSESLRLTGKIDMSAAAISRRLRETAALLDLCQKLRVQR